MAKVLVIDDDPSLNRALRLGLQAVGHDVTTAATGEHGISQTALTAPDVVVLDMGLPDMDGIEVCRTIRGWSDVPIIILSASAPRTERSPRSTPERTTTSPNPSACPNSKRGSGS
jgi:two-component system KDP operon response regulator KdpE